MKCYVPGCKSGNNGSKCHAMRISKRASRATRMKWLRNIPKQEGKPWNFDKYALCSLHFEDKYIVKVNRVMFNGEVMAEEVRKKWKLTDDAVPTIFGNKKCQNMATTTSSISKRKKSPAKGKTGSMNTHDEQRSNKPSAQPAQRVQANQKATAKTIVIPKRAQLTTDDNAAAVDTRVEEEEEKKSEDKKPCLICCHLGKSGIRRNIFLSKPECPANPNTQNTVKENLKVLFMFVLKEVLDFSSDEISSLMSKSRGTEMSEWIHFCKPCFDSINQIVKFQEKIKEVEESIKLHKADISSKIMTASLHRGSVSLEDSAPEKSCVTVTDNIRKIISQRNTHPSPRTPLQKSEPRTHIQEQQQMEFPEAGAVNEDITNFDDSNTSERFQCGPDIIFSKKELKKNSNKEKDNTKYRKVSLKQLYSCPLCPSTELKMDIVKLVPHLMFHKGHPIKCSQCQLYFPENGIQLYRHWMEFHKTLTTIPVHERYLEMKLSDAIEEKLRLQRDPANEVQESSIECANCPNGSRPFSDTNQLKIHQVLHHLMCFPSADQSFVCPKLVDKS